MGGGGGVGGGGGGVSAYSRLGAYQQVHTKVLASN